MHPLIPYIWAAGAAQLLVASASLFAPKMLHYRENLAKLAPIVRQIFIVMNCYIVLVLVAFAGLCFGFAGELAGQSVLGRYFSGFLAIFWSMRVLIQLFFYDRQTKRSHPVFNLLFLAAFVYLAGTFTVAALAWRG
jgi:hypothetical protein